MGPTAQFREQHDELLAIVTEMSGLLKADKLAQDAYAMRSLLSKLKGQIKAHLAMEDKFLYPTLTSHKDNRVRDMAQKYVDEMGSLVGVFVAYTDRWPDKDTIQKNAAGFVKETQGIFEALGSRIERENNELYPLVDSIK